MGDLLEKFEMLDTKGQQQLLDYLDFLLSQKKISKKFIAVAGVHASNKQ